jgi:RNase adaptor protein for sRNA GlmZ degradation
MYSGMSPLIQDVVMQDRNARKAVEHAVAELLAFGAREKREKGAREVSMSVCCTAGTHRSVAIGERIAQGVKAEVQRLRVREGVKVVVRHVSRIKGPGDPF